jgi:tetratricopeptide (TPR) repeat protein
VTIQRATERIPGKIAPTLDKLYDEFRTFGALLNAKIERLQDAVTDQTDPNNCELVYMSNLRECVRSAADVVSTASTTLNADTSDRISVRHGSDFGDVFVKDANEPMLRWFASNTVYEFEDAEAPLPAPSEASTEDVQTEYQSDSDSDIENDLIRSLFNEGRRMEDLGDLESAIRYFRNCLTRLSSNASYMSLTSAKSASARSVSKIELLEHLVDCYCLLGAWNNAKTIMKNKLSITERQVGKKDELYLRDTLRLAELMMKNREYVEAHLQARRSLRGFRKLGETGNNGYEDCLEFLIRMCKTEGKVDEEEAYTALLASRERKIKQTAALSQAVPLSHDSPELPGNSNPVSDIPNEVGPQASHQVEENPARVHDLRDTAILHNGTRSSTQLSLVEPQVRPHEDSQFHPSDRIAPEENSGHVSERDKPTLQQQLSLTRSSSFIQSPDSRPDCETKSLPDDDSTASAQHLLTLVSQEDVRPSRTPSARKVPGAASELSATLTSVPFGDMTLDGYGADIAAAEFICTLYKTALNEATDKELRSQRRDVQFLRAYCNLFYGRDPYYWPQWHIDGYYCMIQINDTHYYRVSGYETEQQAKESAAAKVCERYISRADEVATLATMPRRDPSSDKELHIPENCHETPDMIMRWPKEMETVFGSPFTVTSVPHITISAETDECLARNSDDDEVTTAVLDKVINPRNPPTRDRNEDDHLSFGLLGNVTSAQPISGIDTVPDSPQMSQERHDNHESVGSCRFAWSLGNSTASEGTWACNGCKSDILQYMIESHCRSCFASGDDCCPSSLNDFERQPFDRYQTSLNSLNSYSPKGTIIRRKVILLGDTLCGKTFLATASNTRVRDDVRHVLTSYTNL